MKNTATQAKSVKTLKGQLFGALSMMLVAAIALGTSTYAWFINNRTVEVENMKLEVSTSTSLLVAVGKTTSVAAPTEAGNWTGYKSVIINQDITGIGATAGADVADWADFLENRMTPASVSNYALSTASPKFFLTDNHVANSKLDQFTHIVNGIDAETAGQGPVKRLPLKFSASTGVDVYFGSADVGTAIDKMITPAITTAMIGTAKPSPASGNYTADDVTASALEAEGIRRAIRVALVPQNDATDYKDTFEAAPVIFQFDAGTAVSGNGNNTDYQYVADLDNVLTSTTDNTTKPGSGTIVEEIGKLQDAPAGKYAAIVDSNWTGASDTSGNKHIKTVQIQQTIIPSIAATNYLATVVADGTSATVTAPTGTATPMFQLIADKPRIVNVYIWLEGADEDCLNALSGYDFNLALPFAAVDTAPVAP